MATLKQNKSFYYLVVEPNEIIRKATVLKKDQRVSLGQFIVSATISKAREAGIEIENHKECMLVFSNGKYIIGVPKTISPDPTVFYKDIPMLEKL
mgnify:CR=1 FL=1